MSVRVHVMGALGATNSEFQAALKEIGGNCDGAQPFRMGSSGAWVWANASVWQVGGEEIEKALCTLNVPALRVTSSDGVLWMLTLTGGGRELFRGVHHFTLVGSEPCDPEHSEPERDDEFPDDEIDEVAGINRFIPELQFLWDAEEEARIKKEIADEQADEVEGLDDYTDYGVQLPGTIIADMKRQPHNASYVALKAHGMQIVDALEQFGFKFDRSEMYKLLTVGPLTSREQESDVGNMPRFLESLGIQGVFAESSEDCEGGAGDVATATASIDNENDEDDQPINQAEFPPGELFAKLDPLLQVSSPREIADGPVNVGRYGALFHLLAHMLAENPITVVRLHLPQGHELDLNEWLNKLDNLEIRKNGLESEYAFTTNWWFKACEPEELESNSLSESFRVLPEGALVEMVFLVDGLTEKCHRYSGQVKERCLRLDHAYPQIGVDVLKEAVDLLSHCFGSQSIELRPEEEDIVRHNYQRSTGNVARIRNGKIMPQYGSRDVVIQTLLFERFDQGGPWDIAAGRRNEEAEWELYKQVVSGNYEGDDEEEELDEKSAEEVARFEEMMQQLSNAAEQMQEAAKVPQTAELLYKGRTGGFYRASLADLEHISPEQLKQIDEPVAALGFQFVVDSVGDVDQQQEISRLYIGPQAVALHGRRKQNNEFGWAPVSNGAVLVDFSGGTTEFHSHFEDGSIFVTTTVEAVKSKPEQGIYVRSYEDVSLDVLWNKHRDGIQRFQDHRNTTPVDHSQFADATQLLKRMDNLFVRFLELEV